MPDISVTSDVTADSSQFLADLQRDQSALDQFSQYANSLKIAPQVMIDSTAVTSSFRATLATMVADAQQQGSAINLALAAQLSAVPVTLNTTQAETQLRTLVASVQSITLTFNAPSAQQIGMDIGNAAAAAMQAAMGGMPAGGGGGGGVPGGGGGGGGGTPAGGRSLASYLPHGFGRLLMPLMALHQGMRYFSIQDQEQEHMDASGGDVAKMLEADIRRKKEEDSLLMGAGRVMRFVRESTLGPLFGEQGVDEQEGDLRSLKNAAMRDKFEERSIETRQKHDFEYRREMAPSSQAGRQEELREKQMNRDQADKKSAAERSKEIDELAYARRVAYQHEAKSLGINPKDYTSEELRGNAEYFDRQGMTSEANKYRRLASTLGDDLTKGEREKNEAEYGMEGTRKKQRDEMKVKEDRELKEAQELENRQAGEKAGISEMKAGGGDDAEIQRAELKIKLEKERQDVYRNGTTEQQQAYERTAVAEKQITENKIQQQSVTQGYKLEDIQFKADNASRALSIGKTAAGNEAYLHGLDEEIGKLEKLTNLTKDQREELEKLKSVKGERIATHEEEQRRQQDFENATVQQKIRNSQAEGTEALQQASGDTRGASRARLERQMEEREDSLWQQAKRSGLDTPEGKRLLSELSAERGTRVDKMAAFDTTNQRADEKRIRGINESTEETELRTQHRGYEAGLQGINSKFDEQIRDAREQKNEPLAQALEKQKAAAKEGYISKNKESADDISEHAIEQTLRNQGRGALADARKIERDDKKRLQDATGNADMQAAITADEIASSEARIKGDVLHPANLRNAYDQLLGAAAGGGEARKREQDHLRDLKHQQNLEKQGLDPLTGKPLGPPGKEAHDPAELNAKASEAMIQAAKDISAAALAITSAPQVMLIGWN